MSAIRHHNDPEEIQIMRRSVLPFTLGLLALITLSACAPEIGSEAWCKQMEQKQKGDWSANEAKDYAKHCILK
jgi:hypothetical protein